MAGHAPKWFFKLNAQLFDSQQKEADDDGCWDHEPMIPSVVECRVKRQRHQQQPHFEKASSMSENKVTSKAEQLGFKAFRIQPKAKVSAHRV
jgi:hypothetical protein